MRFAICNEIFEGWTWARTCRFVADTGYDAIELAPFTLADDVQMVTRAERDRIRKDAERCGLSVAGLHWLLIKPPGLHLTSQDAVIRDRTARYLIELARFCGDVGGGVMILGSPKQRSRGTGVSEAQALLWLRDTLERVGDAADQSGVCLCLEPLPAPDTDFINTLEDAARVVQAMSHPAVRLILDVRSMGCEQRPVVDLVRQYGRLARHVHANDTNNRGPGEGETDFVPIFGALREIGYDDLVSVEVFDYTPDPETIARDSLAYMRRAAAQAAVGSAPSP